MKLSLCEMKGEKVRVSKILVMDCSFLMSCLLPDEEENFAGISDYILYVPAIFYTECVSVLNSAVKRNRIKIEYAEQYFDILRAMTVTVDSFCSTPEGMGILYKIARENNLTPYDACYFELAARLNSPIATKDVALIKACTAKSLLIF